MSTLENSCLMFSDALEVINKVSLKIEITRISTERQDFIKDILLELETLLKCPQFNKDSSHCQKCHKFCYSQKEIYNSMLDNLKLK